MKTLFLCIHTYLIRQQQNSWNNIKTEIPENRYDTYAPQQGRSNEEKDEFYELLQTAVDETTDKENLIVGDFNGHVEVGRQGKGEILG